MAYTNNEISRIISNINGLSVGDRAYCGLYGVIECYKSATDNRHGKRLFKVSNSNSFFLKNGGNYTMKSLRHAISGL